MLFSRLLCPFITLICVYNFLSKSSGTYHIDWGTFFIEIFCNMKYFYTNTYTLMYIILLKETMLVKDKDI